MGLAFISANRTKGNTVADPRFAVIVNPKAAGGKAIRKLPEISRVASSIAPEYLLHVTSSIEDARLRAREFADLGVERIVAIGGDGTFNEVANGILEADSRPSSVSSRPEPVAIFPAHSASRNRSRTPPALP